MGEQLLKNETNKHNMDINTYWEQEEKIVKTILSEGAQAYFESLENTETEALPTERVCSCIDERVRGPKFAIPGSGILYGENKAYELLKGAGVTSISSHEDCGAAVLAFENLSDKEKKYYGSADNYAQEFTEHLARKLGIVYEGHRPVETPGIHVARAIYYDASGNFCSDIEGLPKGFTIDHKFSSNKDAKASLELAIKIAMGNHGFGDKFNSDNPLLIIPIGKKGVLNKLQTEISEIMQKETSWAGRIKLDKGIVIKAQKKEKKEVLNRV